MASSSQGTPNPYAPPGAYVEAAVPPPVEGVRRYRLDPLLHRAALRFRMLRTVGIIGVLCPGIVWFNVRRLELDPRVLVAGAVFLGVLMAIAVRRAMNTTVARELETFELLMSDNAALRTVGGLRPVEISRHDVSHIVETPRGLWLSCDAPPRSLYVPAAIIGFTEVRGTFSEWARIEPLGVSAWDRAIVGAFRLAFRGEKGGAAHAVDPRVESELARLRAVSSQAWAAYPNALEGLRLRPRLLLMIGGWVLLLLMYQATSLLFSAAPNRRHTPRRSTTTTTEAAP